LAIKTRSPLPDGKCLGGQRFGRALEAREGSIAYRQSPRNSGWRGRGQQRAARARAALEGFAAGPGGRRRVWPTRQPPGPIPPRSQVAL